jgi:hypothetical protein
VLAPDVLLQQRRRRTLGFPERRNLRRHRLEGITAVIPPQPLPSAAAGPRIVLPHPAPRARRKASNSEREG